MNSENNAAKPPVRHSTLYDGEIAPKARPISQVTWEPGKPPGGTPIAKPYGQQVRKP